MTFRGQFRSKAVGAFTLIELLLVVTLLLLLVSALVFNFSNLMKGSQLAEGTTRLETLMRFARAQAANSGHKVQLVFNSESTNTPASTGEVRATWEPDPLGQPGCFADLEDGQWHVQEINDLVQVESVKLLDSNAAPPATGVENDEEMDDWGDLASSKAISPITFYPDGSSDSAEIIVAAKSPEEDQRMAVRLIGMTGSISHQLLSAALDDMTGDVGIEKPGQPHRDGTVRSLGMESQNSLTGAAVRPGTTGTHSLETAPRTTIGETNSFDQGAE